MKNALLALGAAASLASLSAAPAHAETPPTTAATQAEVRVPFLHIGRFRTFRAYDDETLYLRGSHRRWYRLTTLGPCPNLPWARVIGVDTNRGPTLDRFSTLIVDGDRCQLRSVVNSGEPPKRPRRGRTSRAKS